MCTETTQPTTIFATVQKYQQQKRNTNNGKKLTVCVSNSKYMQCKKSVNTGKTCAKECEFCTKSEEVNNRP